MLLAQLRIKLDNTGSFFGYMIAAKPANEMQGCVDTISDATRSDRAASFNHRRFDNINVRILLTEQLDWASFRGDDAAFGRRLLA